MELDLLPRRNPNLTTTDELPEGMTHSEDDPCPFARDGLPTGAFGTCCSFCGKVVAEHLDGFGEADVANLMYEDLSASAARAVASVLRASALRIERRYPSRKERAKGATSVEGAETEPGITTLSQPSFEEALASIRKAADWYQKVGRLGFEVHAQY